jgi:predicted lipoprotein with Yx(FWY)xxD motif
MTKTRVTVVAILAAGLAALSACGSGTHTEASQPDKDAMASLNLASGTAMTNDAPPDTGDLYNGPSNSPAATKWVQLSAGSAGTLRPIVRNGAGFTLYRFDKDTAHPSTSNCTGACATTWPPVLVRPGSKIYLDGVSKSDVGVVRRDEGMLQVTIGGWPVYRFSKDTQPGQTNGEGVGGTWFAVSPRGSKVTPPPAGSAPTASAGPTAGTVTLGNGSVLLDSGKNFTEPDGSEGISGPGCRNVAQPKLASSLTLTGGPIKIWTGPNCTGTSALVKGDIADLATIGFDKKIVSIRFGS